jgi:hypothetical protein
VSLASRPGHSSNGRKTPSTRCYCELSKVTSHGNFFKLFSAADNLNRLTIKDKIIPTLINFNRVDIVLSSNVDSCCFKTVRIFNIINLHFGERGGTKLATLHCNVGSLASGPARSRNGQMMTLARCSSDRRPLLCDVIDARCYCDRTPYQ